MAVYFLADHVGHVKIGWSKNPAARVAELQTGHAMPLTVIAVIPGDRAVERAFHLKFSRCHVGGEWFDPDERMSGFLEGLTANGDRMRQWAEDVELEAYDSACVEIAEKLAAGEDLAIAHEYFGPEEPRSPRLELVR